MPIDHTRRLVVQATGLAAAGLTLAPSVLLGKQHEARPLGVAVVGLGDFAKVAMPRITASGRARVVALVSGNQSKAEEYAQTFGIEHGHLYNYQNFERLSEDPTVDLVYLTLPVGLHAEFAIRAMKAGKHVLSEKTLAATVAEAESMLAVARETGRHLMIAYRTCFGPAYETVSRLIAGKEFGRVVHVDVHKGFPIALPAGNWRFDRQLAGGGSLVDVGVYSVQAARMFGGGMPSEVTAQAFSSPDPRFAEVDDTVVFTLRFPNGALASGSSSWSYRLQNRLRVGLERAWLDLEPASSVMNQVLRIAKLEDGHEGEVQPLPQEDQIPLMFDHMAEVILDGVPTRVPASDGLLDLRIIDAIYRAIASGKTEQVG